MVVWPPEGLTKSHGLVHDQGSQYVPGSGVFPISEPRVGQCRSEVRAEVIPADQPRLVQGSFEVVSLGSLAS